MLRLPRTLLAAVALVGAAAVGSAQANSQDTIRAMSGAQPIDHLPAGRTALLVIDYQNEYFSGRMPIPNGASAMARTRDLISFADTASIPVFHIQHVAPEGSALFAKGGETVRFHADMQPRPQDTIVQKTTVSVFASSDIDRQLKARNIDTLIITGLMTHACVAGAARDAAPLGYKVVVASDATATRSITRLDGTAVDANALHNAALAEIEDTFGDVLSSAAITQLPVR